MKKTVKAHTRTTKGKGNSSVKSHSRKTKKALKNKYIGKGTLFQDEVNSHPTGNLDHVRVSSARKRNRYVHNTPISQRLSTFKAKKKFASTQPHAGKPKKSK